MTIISNDKNDGFIAFYCYKLTDYVNFNLIAIGKKQESAFILSLKLKYQSIADRLSDD